MHPSTLDAVQYDEGRHHEIYHEIDRLQLLQSLRLRQRPRESCADAKIFVSTFKTQPAHKLKTTLTAIVKMRQRHFLHSPSSNQFWSATDWTSSPMRDIIVSSGTKLPLSMYFFTSLPRSVNRWIQRIYAFKKNLFNYKITEKCSVWSKMSIRLYF